MVATVQQLWRKFGKGGSWELIPRAYHMVFAHIMGFHGFYYFFTGQIHLQHYLFGIVLTYLSAIGIAAGAHRLWSHRSYKAKLPLRILLMIIQTLAGQGSLYCWARDHRLHHKYSETEADPHNIQRGIFFTHIGWTMLKERPEVTEKEKTIDFSDLHNDSVVAFQHKYFRIFDAVLYHIMPILIPYYFWQPSLYICLCVNYSRFVVSYNTSSLGNSVAHTWIRKPYEKTIGPADVTWLSLLIVGEGWHNFHHVFPWDYRSTDVGMYVCNLATAFIDLMAKIGWAYDLKTVPDHVIRKRAMRTGDGSHPSTNNNLHDDMCTEESKDCTNDENNDENSEGLKDFNRNKISMSIDKVDVGEIEPSLWGWGDEEMLQEDIQDTVLMHAKSQ